MRDTDFEEDNREEHRSPYCPICDACGEEGCCSPVMCKFQEGGSYCDRYLKDLKFNYVLRSREDFREQTEEEYDELYKHYYETNNNSFTTRNS